jgi:transcription elongation factor GreB
VARETPAGNPGGVGGRRTGRSLGKKQLREIDRRIRFLQKRIDDLMIVDRAPEDTSRIFFGARVRLVNETGEIQEYRIVGADEFDLKQGLISIDSPLARALLKKSVDDEITLTVAHAQMTYTILEIDYPSFFADKII